MFGWIRTWSFWVNVCQMFFFDFSVSVDLQLVQSQLFYEEYFQLYIPQQTTTYCFKLNVAFKAAAATSSNNATGHETEMLTISCQVALHRFG